MNRSRPDSVDETKETWSEVLDDVTSGSETIRSRRSPTNPKAPPRLIPASGVCDHARNRSYAVSVRRAPAAAVMTTPADTPIITARATVATHLDRSSDRA